MVFSVVVNWSKQWLRSAMDNALPLHVEGLGFDFFRLRLFFFVVVLFSFFFKETYRKRFAASIYWEITK